VFDVSRLEALEGVDTPIRTLDSRKVHVTVQEYRGITEGATYLDDASGNLLNGG
jgi:hypothetical protein